MTGGFSNLLSFLLPPTPVADSDGVLYPNAALALLSDLISRKWADLLPVLQSGSVIRKTRRELDVSQASLAREAGISQQRLAAIERGNHQLTEATVHKIWASLWRLDQRRRAYVSPEVLVRIEGEVEGIITTIEKVKL